MSRASKPFVLLTIFYISMMFLPRLVPKGMFGDGLLYASISRNLAQGIGTWWTPFFSHGYWLDGVSPESYFENPPMMFWIQSMFFRVLGDHWWVEKLFSLLLLAFNCFLISRVWEIMLRGRSRAEGNFGWLPVWFFYLIPIVVWGSPHNLLDPLLLTFCLLAIRCLLTALKFQRNRLVFFTLTIICIFVGVLTKGPVALYPVAVPFLYQLIFDRKKIWNGLLLSTFLLAIIIILFSVLLLWDDAARHFFSQYWQQRLVIAIKGGRADGLRTGWIRFYIFWLLLRENVLILSVSILLFLSSLLKKVSAKEFSYERKLSLFYLLLAFTATVPVIMSTRQAGMYLIPGLPLFALSAGYFHLPFFWYWLSRMNPLTIRIMNAAGGIAILVVIIYSITIFGKPGREKELLNDIAQIQKLIPAGEHVAVCEEINNNFVYHVYLQRFHHIELTRELSGSHYYFTNLNCRNPEPGHDLLYDGQLLNVYTLKEPEYK